MFSIIREDFFGVEKIKLLDSITGEYVSILPAWGGNLNELVLLNKGVLHSIIAGDTSVDSLKGDPINFYRGAKLSPFPNRIAGGAYTFQDQVHTLDANDGMHALHGLLWDCPFRIAHEETTADFAAIELAYDYISNYTGYPFTYSISIAYRLEASRFSCSTTIHNTGNETLPVGDGWHPYFHVSNMDTLKLKLPACKQLEMNACITTGNYIESDFFTGEVLLKDLELDHCFELSATDGIVETELIDVDRDLKIGVWQQCGGNRYTFLQLYTPPDRMSIAIEPMSCAPNAFNTKKGLIELESGQEVRFTFGIQVR
jgi:aldose 1-epimerase